MELLKRTLAEIEQGWYQQAEQYRCNYCEFVAADQATIEKHLVALHPEADLIHAESRYNVLTDKQKSLLTLFAAGKKDQEVAQLLQLSPSTVRHQKFTFRERAKQAKFYLAMFEKTFDHAQKDQLLPVPSAAGVLDDRFAITEDEFAALTQKYFTFPNGQLTLTRWPKGQKKIVAILHRIIEEFEHSHKYAEPEVNAILQPIYFDYVLVRRYLVDDGFLARTTDGQQYWRIF